MRALVKRALVGTSRVPDAPEATGTAADALVASLDLTPERRLLLRAGAVATLARAASPAATPPPAADVAAAESLEACASGSTDVLRRLLAGEHRALLPELAGALARAGRRLPHALLPAALDTTDPAERQALRSLLGERGRWLATRRERWAWGAGKELAGTLPADADRIWEEGSPAERREILILARALDPARGRSWVAAAFGKEKAETRASWLEAMRGSVTPEDEPFLEKALDDRSASVRAAAASLLTTLPGSALSGRMSARVESLVSIDGSPGALRVEPPQEIDRTWERDGIAATPPAGVGKRAYWLAWVVAALSPVRWEVPGRPPMAFLAMALRTDWGGPLVAGLARATIAFRAGEWAAALWDLGREKTPPDELKPHLAGLLDTIPPAALAARSAALLGDGVDPAMGDVLSRLPRPWDMEIGRLYLRRLRSLLEAATAAPERSFPILSTLDLAARALPPDLLEGAATALGDAALPPPADTESWGLRRVRSALDDAHEILRLRRIVMKEIQP